MYGWVGGGAWLAPEGELPSRGGGRGTLVGIAAGTLAVALDAREGAPHQLTKVGVADGRFSSFCP